MCSSLLSVSTDQLTEARDVLSSVRETASTSLPTLLPETLSSASSSSCERSPALSMADVWLNLAHVQVELNQCDAAIKLVPLLRFVAVALNPFPLPLLTCILDVARSIPVFEGIEAVFP
jgi:hypothetical protein